MHPCFFSNCVCVCVCITDHTFVAVLGGSITYKCKFTKNRNWNTNLIINTNYTRYTIRKHMNSGICLIIFAKKRGGMVESFYCIPRFTWAIQTNWFTKMTQTSRTYCIVYSVWHFMRKYLIPKAWSLHMCAQSNTHDTQNFSMTVLFINTSLFL